METIFVYGVTDCPHCLWACADLMEAGTPYVFVNMDYASDYREHIKEKFSWETYPIIVELSNEATLIGGYEQLKEYMK
jgi:glutaredoxin